MGLIKHFYCILRGGGYGSADVDGTDERGLCGGSGESSGGDCKVGGVQAAGGGESEGEILDEVSESIAGKNRERRVEQMTAATEDEEVLSFRIAELNSGRSFVVGYGDVWKLLSAVDKLQQYGAAAEATVGQVLHIMES